MAAHVHAELMMALAMNDKLVIETRDYDSEEWSYIDYPTWHQASQYRIKPAGPVINLEIAGMTNDVLEVMKSDLLNQYDFATVDVVHEFAQKFARVLVQQCADAADHVTGANSLVGTYMIEALGYSKDSL